MLILGEIRYLTSFCICVDNSEPDSEGEDSSETSDSSEGSSRSEHDENEEVETNGRSEEEEVTVEHLLANLKRKSPKVKDSQAFNVIHVLCP